MSPAEICWAELVEKSGLLSKEQVHAFLGRLRMKVPSDHLSDERRLSEHFVEAGLLTSWQAQELLQGKRKRFLLGSYKLLRPLGAGVCTTYLAEHRTLQTLRAVKMLPPNRSLAPNYLQSIRNWVGAAAAIDHPNVVRIHDFDRDGDVWFLVFDYFEAADLQTRVAMQGVPSRDHAVDYVRQAACGLAEAHRAGLTDCDVRPANLLVDDRGAVKITGLGLHGLVDGVIPPEAVDYLAPELAIHGRAVDARADIYSLGCTLYFALTGRPPFPDGTIAQRLMAHQLSEPPSIADDRPGFPDALANICRRMIAKNVDERFQSAIDVEQALGRLTGG